MSFGDTLNPSRLWLYAILALVLVACLWVGWSDFNPWIPQDEIRENIRFTTRWVIQILIQYIIPGAIVMFFGKKAFEKMRGSHRRS